MSIAPKREFARGQEVYLDHEIEAISSFLPYTKPLDRERTSSDQQSDHWSQNLGCPGHRDRRRVNPETGEVWYPLCGYLSCVFCTPSVAKSIAGAIALARPTLAILLTDLPSLPDFRRFLYEIRKEAPDFIWCRSIERRAGGTEASRHLHGWGRTSCSLDEGSVKESAARAGFGWSAANPMRQSAGLSVAYSLKTVIDLHRAPSYEDAQETLDTYLSDNRGRLISPSRGFWLDGQSQPTTLREARRAFCKRRWAACFAG